MRPIISALAACLLAGCASVPQTADSIAAKTVLATDDYRKTFSVASPEFTMPEAKAMLRAGGKQDESAQWYDIRVGLHGTEWAFPESAVDRDGHELRLTDRDSHVYGASTLWEQFTIELSRSYLEDAAKNGLNIRIDGKRRNQVIAIDAEYVRGFLAKVDQK